MEEIELIQYLVNGYDRDLLIDASEGQQCGLYEFMLGVQNEKKSVFLKAIAIRLDPVVFRRDSDIIVFANYSV